MMFADFVLLEVKLGFLEKIFLFLIHFLF